MNMSGLRSARSTQDHLLPPQAMTAIEEEGEEEEEDEEEATNKNERSLELKKKVSHARIRHIILPKTTFRTCLRRSLRRWPRNLGCFLALPAPQ